MKMEKMILGAQLYTVREHMKTEEDFARTMDKIAAIMSRFRDPALTRLGELKILAVEDYAAGTRTEKTGEVTTLDIPKADVLKLFFETGTLAVRPSGTEPNIKFYCSVSGKTLQQAQDNLAAMRAALDEMIG